MTLSVISSPKTIVGNIGELKKVSYMVQSDTPLTGKLIRVHAGLFMSDQSAIPINNTVQWQVIYQSSGDYLMTYVGDPVNENRNVKIKAQDAFNFTIEYEFWWLKDVNGYLGDVSYVNSQAITGAAGVNNKFINLFIDVEGANVVASHVAQSGGLCPEDFTFDLGEMDGYKPGQNLTIDIEYEGTELIYNNFYAGFYSASPSNAQFLEDDLSLNYGLVTGAVAQKVSIDQSPVITCFSGGTGFLNDKASVEINGACLTGGQYYLYIIYQTPSGWNTCISQAIRQQAAEKDLVTGNVTTTITHLDTDYVDTNVSGLAPLGKTRVCYKIDRASFESELATAGIDGTMEEYFASAKIVSSELAPTSSPVSGFGLSSSYAFTSDGLELCGDYTPNGGGDTRWLSAQVVFDYGLYGRDVLIIPVRVAYTALIQNVRPPIFLVTADGSQVLNDRFCCESEGTVEFDLGSCDYFIGEGRGAYQPLSGGFVSTDVLECEKTYCIRAICDSGAVNSPGSGECDQTKSVSFTISKRESIYSDPLGMVDDELTTWYMNINVVGDYSSIQVTHLATGIVMTSSGQMCSAAEGTGGFDYDDCGPGILDNQIEIVLVVDGETHTETATMSDVVQISGEKKAEYSNTIQFTGDCEDEEENECLNRMWVEWTCDEETGTITYNVQEDFASPTNEVNESIEEEEGKVVISRTATFRDGCAPVELYQVIECIKEDPCVNSREHAIEVIDCKLIVTLNDQFDSMRLRDVMYIVISHLDGTVDEYEYDIMTMPYTNDLEVCWGDKIKIDTFTAFDDGCLDLNYSIEEYEYAPESTSVRTITVIENAGILELLILSNFETGFVIASDTLRIEINDNIYEYDQTSTPYQNDLPVEAGDLVCVSSVTTAQNCCYQDVIFERLCVVIGEGAVSQDPCEYGEYSLDLRYDNAEGKFEIEYTGDPMANQHAKMFPMFTLGNGLNPLDANDSGNPIFESPFTLEGEGLLIVAWKIQIENCDPKELRKYIVGKKDASCDEPTYVELCESPILTEIRDNLNEVANKECDPPVVNVNIEAPCDESACACNIAATCTGQTDGSGVQYGRITIQLSGDNCTGATVSLTDANGAEITPSGTLQWDIYNEGIYYINLETSDSCTDQAAYYFNIPNTGDPAQDVPTFSPVLNK